jgi:murein DD-endopeptidase MepM/ murein hydrolase activator NlpD
MKQVGKAFFLTLLFVFLYGTTTLWAALDAMDNYAESSETPRQYHAFISPFDLPSLSLTARERAHEALDIRAPVGTPVYAVADGIVVLAEPRSNYGLVVFVNHANGMQSRYAHLRSASVSVGQRVQQSQKIGEVGMTGRTTGPHLHLELVCGIYGSSAWGESEVAKLGPFEIIDLLHIHNYSWSGRLTNQMLQRERQYYEKMGQASLTSSH